LPIGSSFCCVIIRRPPSFTLFPYTTLFRSITVRGRIGLPFPAHARRHAGRLDAKCRGRAGAAEAHAHAAFHLRFVQDALPLASRDRKSTRLNSSHVSISYAVFCLKKKITVYLGALAIAASCPNHDLLGAVLLAASLSTLSHNPLLNVATYPRTRARNVASLRYSPT